MPASRFYLSAILLLLPLLCLTVASSRAQTLAADSLYQLAQSQYDEGNFEQAELAALRGLRELEGQDELTQTHFRLLLGYIYVARDQNDFAEREFLHAIFANPALELDPVQTSPKIREVFTEAKKTYMVRVMSEPAVYRLPQADVRLSASWRSLVLPGWGQIYKEQKVKGAIFAAAEFMSLAALVVMQADVNRRHKDYQRIKNYDSPELNDRYAEYRRAYQTRNVVGYVTLGIYGLNYLDALYTPVKRKFK